MSQYGPVNYFKLDPTQRRKTAEEAKQEQKARGRSSGSVGENFFSLSWRTVAGFLIWLFTDQYLGGGYALLLAVVVYFILCCVDD